MLKFYITKWNHGYTCIMAQGKLAKNAFSTQMYIKGIN